MRVTTVGVLALALGVVACWRPARALEPVGEPTPTGSWAQAFTEFGSGPFDHIQLRTLAGDGFVVSLEGITDFSDGAWCQSYNDGTLLTADGPTRSFLGFRLHFAGDLVDPLSFDYQIWHGATLQASLQVDWDGSGFTVGSSAWSEGRLDPAQGLFSGQFDTSHTGVLPGCAARAVYTVSLGPVCGADLPDYFHSTAFVEYPANFQPVAVEQLYFPGVPHTFQYSALSGGSIEVSLSLFGQVTDHAGPLFAVHFDLLADLPPNEVGLGQVVLRKPVNQPMVAFAGPPDGLVVDDDLPDATLADLPPDTCHTDAGFFVTLSATDDQGLAALQYRFDGGSWANTGLAVSGTGWGPVVWPVDLTGLPDGHHRLEIRALDQDCNGGLPQGWEFHLDNTAPQAVSVLRAYPRDHAVLLEWPATTGHEGYRLYRWERPGYPYSGGAASQGIPSTLVATLPAGSTSWLDDFGTDSPLSRAVCDYRLDAFDCSNGTVTGTAIASATNYFLGDWAGYDGAVCAPDLGPLSLYYNTVPVVGLSDELDVGPTSDGSSFGLPLPDALIGFEDLVVFALNYRPGCGSPLLAQPRGKDLAINGLSAVELEPEGRTLRIRLDGALLAARLELAGQARITAARFVGPGPGGLAFFHHEAPEAPEARPLPSTKLDLALLASDPGGEALLVLELDRPCDLRLLSAELRDGENRASWLDHSATAAPLPLAFGLQPSRPNPFNPTTRIRFVLEEASSVDLTVYNLAGARVAVLERGMLPAGEHERPFDGTALASGPYWIRLQAGARVDTGSVLLVR